MVPLILVILPFLLLAVGTYYLVNWLIKKSNALRPIALFICLITGAISIFCGFKLLGVFLISPFIIMALGGFLILVGGFRSIFTSKHAVIKEESENKIAEEKQKIEDNNYHSYEWLCQEARRILVAGKIEDVIKYRRLKDTLDCNRKYPELKRLCNELMKLEDKEIEMRRKALENSRQHFR